MSSPSAYGWVVSPGCSLTIGRTADERTARAARRFSWLATIGIAIVAVTGLLRAIAEVGTVDALLTSDFGHLVIAKTALLATLAAARRGQSLPERPGRWPNGPWPSPSRVGRIARRRDRPPPDRVARQPRAAGRGRCGGCRAIAPPERSPVPVIVEGSDFGTSVKVRLAVSPGTAGFDTFTATVTDYDSGAPVPADGVTLRFVLPGALGCRELAARSRAVDAGRLHGDRHEPVARWDVADHRTRGPWRVVGRGPARTDDTGLRSRRRVSEPVDRCQRRPRSADHLHGPPVRRPDGPGLPRPGQAWRERGARHFLRRGRQRAAGGERDDGARSGGWTSSCR